jgi:hypothetical protein
MFGSSVSEAMMRPNQELVALNCTSTEFEAMPRWQRDRKLQKVLQRK